MASSKTEKTPPSANSPLAMPCDEPSKRRFTIWGHVFEVDDAYEPIKGMGKGAYGVVTSARDRRTGGKVAIKKIGSAFANSVDALRTLREVQLLRRVEHENVIGIRDVMSPGAGSGFEDVYVVYECMDTDLHQIIKSPQSLTDDHMQYFIWQLLRGLKYLHSANIIHRDLKPSNLLLNASCDLRICDFGLARANTKRNDMTKYVVTRWYRAPELLLSCAYTSAIDMWSVGCILAELLQRKPMFQGAHYIQQIENILRTLGHPTAEELGFVNHPKAKAFCLSVKVPKETLSMKQRFPNANPKAVDLLEKLLQFDPKKRPSAEEALRHPWLASLHDEADEPTAEEHFEFEFEEEDLTVEDIRILVYREVQLFKLRNAQTTLNSADVPTAMGC